MEEKTLVKLESGGAKLICKGICVALLILGFVSGVYTSLTYMPENGFGNYFWTSILPYCMSLHFLPLAGVALVLYLWVALTELTVTNKRVYGKTSFGKRVDLPLDSISAVGTGWFKSISVSTSSGRITFFAVSNRNEFHKVISELLISRQDKNAVSNSNSQSTNSADELKKYKELLDSGIITQEEFDAKKKKLLGV